VEQIKTLNIMKDFIGTNAGLVWKALNENGKMDVKALKRATKIRAEKNLYAAFGWLAKEGKVEFTEEGKNLFVELV